MNHKQNAYARDRFFRTSIAKAQAYKKKKKDIQMIKNGEAIEPDPEVVTSGFTDTVEDDPEEVVNDEQEC